MGIDAGFDMVPHLSRGSLDCHNWSRFIDFVKKHYAEDAKVELKPNYIEFKVGEHPILPFEGHKFLRFSSKISGGCSPAARYVEKVATIAGCYFGSRARYWNEAFDQRGHYGWEEVHESIRSYEQPDDPMVPTTVSHMINGTSPFAELGIPLFDVKDMPGKGKGLVSRFNIPPGTRIIFEKPLLLAQPLPPAALEQSLASKLKRLSKTEQRQFLSLHNNLPGKHPFGGIVKTNALPCGSGSAVGGVYPTICFINHSCRPNSQNTWNSDLEHETIHAIRPIGAGEEITISYGQGGPSATRQASLKEAFGFLCSCDVCSLPPAELQQSDTCRSSIQRLDDRIGDPMRMATSPKDSLRDCHSLLSLLNAEHGDCPGALAARLYYDAFQISIAHGDQARASVFAEKSYKARLVCEGDDTPEAKRVKALAARPSDHGSFGACSSKWKSTRDMIPKGLDAEAFEKWLFHKEG